MSRLQPMRQQGFGLLVFVLIASIISISIILGYSGLMTREAANRRPVELSKDLDRYREQLAGFYLTHAATFDDPSASNTTTIDDILDGASIPRRRGLKAALSQVLPGDSGLKYRRVVLYFPSLSDGTNPPDIEAFQSTGIFKGCLDSTQDCSEPIHIVFDSLTIHKDALQETQRRLERVALKAQAYFKARMLQDPEKNISVNYFRPPFGGCSPTAYDLDCLDTYQPLATLDGNTWVPRTQLPSVLGISQDELVNGWGYPIEASNSTDSERTQPPYTMVFRSPSPFGGYFTIKAVQQI